RLSERTRELELILEDPEVKGVLEPGVDLAQSDDGFVLFRDHRLPRVGKHGGCRRVGEERRKGFERGRWDNRITKRHVD
ncbi:MAG: hypothetical protein WD942_03455, partial [Dehalococcoidia bacterium]